MPESRGRKATWTLLLIFGLLLVLVGIGLGVTYLITAVLGTSGKVDRSLLYWYSPMLLMGMMLAGLGAVAASEALRRTRTSKSSPKRT